MIKNKSKMLLKISKALLIASSISAIAGLTLMYTDLFLKYNGQPSNLLFGIGTGMVAVGGTALISSLNLSSKAIETSKMNSNRDVTKSFNPTNEIENN